MQMLQLTAKPKEQYCLNPKANLQILGLLNWLWKKVYLDTGLVSQIRNLKANLFIRAMINQLVSIGGIEGNPTTRGITVIKMKIVFMPLMARENGKIFVARKNTPMYVKNLPHIVLMRSIAYQKRNNWEIPLMSKGKKWALLKQPQKHKSWKLQH